MPAKKTDHDLEQAMALLIQNQAMFVRDMAEIRRDMGEIRKDLELIKGYLIRHEQLLAALPEAIREQIGFKPRP